MSLLESIIDKIGLLTEDERNYLSKYLSEYTPAPEYQTDVYKLLANGETLVAYVEEITDYLGMDSITELYEHISNKLKFSKQQLDIWLNALDNDWAYNIKRLYASRNSFFNFSLDGSSSHTMGYGYFMKRIRVFCKKWGYTKADDKVYERTKLSFKRSNERTTLINRKKPELCYRDNGWIEDKNFDHEDLSGNFKSLRLD